MIKDDVSNGVSSNDETTLALGNIERNLSLLKNSLIFINVYVCVYSLGLSCVCVIILQILQLLKTAIVNIIDPHSVNAKTRNTQY